MLTIVFKIFILAATVEALTEISKAYITSPLWNLVFRITSNFPIFNAYISYLVTCGYCKSFWISFFCCVLCYYFQCFPVVTGNLIINFFLVVLLVHRLSNVVHFFIDRLDTSKDLRYNKKD